MTIDPNTIIVQDSVPPTPPPIETPPAPAPIDCKTHLRRWTRLLLASNPFYILSAVLVLWSMDRLSLDSRLFASELPQLFFNVSAFQLYEALLVGTAIFLATRGIWYDSGLLVGLENLFIVVPFILISQVLLADRPEALVLCLAGCVLAVIRVAALRRWISGIQMPGRLLMAGVVLLTVNLAFPTLLWFLHKDATLAQWDDRSEGLKNLEWLALAPLCAGLVFALPRAQSEGVRKTMYFRPSFPLGTFLLWAAGTLTHLYCISYVYHFNVGLSCLVPALWATAWGLWNRALDFDFVPPSLRAEVSRVLSLAPIAILGWAMAKGEWPVCLALTALNAVIYGGLARKTEWFRHLSLVSLALALGALPLDWFSGMGLHVARSETLAGACGVFIWIQAVMSRNPRLGILGAILMPFLVNAAVPWHLIQTNFALAQLGLLFLLVHSLRWEDGKEQGTSALRLLVALLWVGTSLLWLATNPALGARGTVLSALVLLGAYWVARQMTGSWGPWILPVAAGVVLLLQPLFWGAKTAGAAFELAGHIPTGLLMLGAGFGLFFIGTVVALTRSRWSNGK